MLSLIFFFISFPSFPFMFLLLFDIPLYFYTFIRFISLLFTPSFSSLSLFCFVDPTISLISSFTVFSPVSYL